MSAEKTLHKDYLFAPARKNLGRPFQYVLPRRCFIAQQELPYLRYVLVVYCYQTGLDIIEPKEQLHDGRFTVSGRPHQGYCLPSLHLNIT